MYNIKYILFIYLFMFCGLFNVAICHPVIGWSAKHIPKTVNQEVEVA